MSTRESFESGDDFNSQFQALLDTIPAGDTLPKWQFLYAQVIVSMGLRILQKFEADLVGRNPFLAQSGSQQQQQQPSVSPGPIPGAGGGVSPIIQPDTKGGGSSGGGRPSVIIIATLALDLQTPTK